MSTWILLRGLTRETRHWGRLPVLLREASPAARVLMLDLPGNGASAALSAPLSVEDMVTFVRRAALQHGAPPPYRVLAMSLGGMVATAWAQAHPGEVEQLVLINTSMRPFNHAWERLRPQRWLELIRLAMCWRDARAAETVIHRITCNRRDAFDADLAEWVAIRENAPVSRGNAVRQLIAAARFRALSSPPACPVLLLSSQQDRLVNAACSASLATAWRARHAQQASAGHDLPHDDPDWICAMVASWQAELAADPVRSA
ncbi:alpha/beta fold hydrolase [Paraburkholderia dinghuensis]|uniref:Alpha/beta hydrolase n=1 Tax=Paraburkholderia dinghuensis TaxID=2305225 RepID=A0A3N6MNW9_9BURK|nr:alpha/beta hydrolase [Paraburkholderia dinghuensis]RQH05399.1 alpha/beta hydrolase [Paraburkholderia dinghuensis]